MLLPGGLREYSNRGGSSLFDTGFEPSASNYFNGSVSTSLDMLSIRAAMAVANLTRTTVILKTAGTKASIEDFLKESYKS